MTRDEILNMPAGRELDVLIAEKVMGLDSYEHDWQADGECSKCRCDIDFHSGFIYLKNKKLENRDCINPDPYSDYIAFAWRVVEMMQEKCIDFSLTEGYSASFLNIDGWVSAVACETMPLAICRAALLAVMENDEHSK